jgi:type I restriction enzyme S subunit
VSKAVLLSEIADIVRGISFPKEAKSLEPRPGDVACLRTTNVQKQVEWDDLWFVPAEHVKRNEQYVQAGDILISTANSYELVGKVAPVTTVPHKATLGAFISLIRPREGVEPKYLYHQLAWGRTQSRIRETASTTTNISNVSTKKLMALEFSIPPIDEQRSIVAEIEKQFSRLDEAVAGLQRVKANLKRHKAAVLKAAVEGRLVPTEADLARREGRNYETGAQLLQRILETRRSQWQGKGKYKEPVAPDTTDLPELPEGWVWATVDQLLRERIVNGLSVKESASPTTVKALRLSAMTDQGLDYDDCRYLPVSEDSVSDIVVCQSDFFVSRGNGSLNLVGRGSRAQTPTQMVIFPDTMMRLRLTTVADVLSWAVAIWSARFVREQVESRVKTTAGIYKMAQPELASIALPLPPLAEQHRIVAEVDRLLSIAREAETEVEANLKRAQALRQAILADCFS